MKIHHYSAFASLLALTSVAALAAPSDVTVTQTTTPTTSATINTTTPVSTDVDATVTAPVSSDINATVNTPAATTTTTTVNANGVGTTTGSDAALSGSAITTTNLNADTSLNMSGTVSATLDATNELNSIRGTERANRQQLSDEIKIKIDASQKAWHSAKSEARPLSGQARDDFKAASKDVENAKERLERSVRKARNADDNEWSQAREQVATDYQAYAEAIARAEAAANVGVSVNVGR